MFSVTNRGLHKGPVNGISATQTGSIPPLQPIPVKTSQARLEAFYSDVGLDAEMKKFEEELLELQQDDSSRQNSMKLERLKREVEEKKETVRKLRGKCVLKVEIL